MFLESRECHVAQSTGEIIADKRYLISAAKRRLCRPSDTRAASRSMLFLTRGVIRMLRSQLFFNHGTLDAGLVD